VLGEMPGLGDVTVAMPEHPQAAAGCRGFDPISFGVQDRSDLGAWASYLDTLGIRHSPVMEASFGWLLVLNDADGLELHLYTWAEHGIDQSARPGYGRRIVAETSVDASSPQMLQASR
jgi:hypothetical protein